jgi:cytochrome P450
MGLAMMEMTLIVPTILQQYRLRRPDDPVKTTPEPLLAIRPRGGLRMKLTAV